MTSRLLLVLVAGFSITAFANTDAANECNITENKVLTENSVAHCDSFRIAPGVTVVTHEFTFSRRSDSFVVCGTPETPCHIVCQADGDTYSMAGKTCGRTVVKGIQAEGALDANLDSGRIDVVFSGYGPTYRQNIQVGPDGLKTIYRGDTDVTADESKFRWTN